MEKKTDELMKNLKHASSDTLDTILNQASNITFSEYFTSLCDTYHKTKSDVINISTLDRTYAYQILQGRKKGSKDKIILLALGLSCSNEECDKLLTLSGNSILYANHKRDALLIYAIEKKYTVLKTNELLIEYNEPILQ